MPDKDNTDFCKYQPPALHKSVLYLHLVRRQRVAARRVHDVARPAAVNRAARTLEDRPDPVTKPAMAGQAVGEPRGARRAPPDERVE
jgi:hypothetical protein